MQTCFNCNREIEEDYEYCPFCGFPQFEERDFYGDIDDDWSDDFQSV